MDPELLNYVTDAKLFFPSILHYEEVPSEVHSKVLLSFFYWKPFEEFLIFSIPFFLDKIENACYVYIYIASSFKPSAFDR